MELNWTKVDFRNPAGKQPDAGDRLRAAQQVLARDLSISLSAFLRGTVTATYSSGGEILFNEFLKAATPSCFGVALVRPQQCRLLLQVEYAVLFPIIGIALGAKPGGFVSPDRTPTEIEFQVVNLLFRMLLSEAYRAWAGPLKTTMETISLEVEPRPARTFAATDPVFALRFGVTIGEHAGQVAFVAPASLFAAGMAEEQAPVAQQSDPSRPVDAALDLMMDASVRLDVWLDGSQMRLGDLLQLGEGQIVKLDHPVERKAVCTLNGQTGFAGQIVSTGTRRAFLVEDQAG